MRRQEVKAGKIPMISYMEVKRYHMRKNKKKYHVHLLKRNELLTLGTSVVNICQLISGLLIAIFSKTILQQLVSEKPFLFSLRTEKLLWESGQFSSILSGGLRTLY